METCSELRYVPSFQTFQNTNMCTMSKPMYQNIYLNFSLVNNSLLSLQQPSLSLILIHPPSLFLSLFSFHPPSISLLIPSSLYLSPFSLLSLSLSLSSASTLPLSLISLSLYLSFHPFSISLLSPSLSFFSQCNVTPCITIMTKKNKVFLMRNN